MINFSDIQSVWVLGLGFAVALAVLNALWLELNDK